MLRLAVRLIDFLVAKSGCDAIRPATVAAILERPGKWEVLRILAKAVNGDFRNIPRVTLRVGNSELVGTKNDEQ